jgi:hypothetical protein
VSYTEDCSTAAGQAYWPNNFTDPRERRIEALYLFINQVGKSGFVDLKPVYKELIELLGLPQETLWDAQATVRTPVEIL